MTVRRHTDEPLNRHFRAANVRASDNALIGSGNLRFALAVNPFADERGFESSVRCMRPSVSEEYRAHGVFLARGDQFRFVVSMRVGFGSGEEPRTHHYAIGAQAERCR